MNIKERIIKLRRISGLTQVELAREIGRSKAQMNHYEKGRNTPPLIILERLAKAFQKATGETVQVEDIVSEGTSAQSVSRAIHSGHEFMDNRKQVITFDQLILDRLTAIEGKLDKLAKKK